MKKMLQNDQENSDMMNILEVLETAMKKMLQVNQVVCGFLKNLKVKQIQVDFY